MIRKPPLLTPRLAAVAELTGQCNCFADIGTDHAYLPIFLYMTDKCRQAVACDVRKGPLERAASSVAEYGINAAVSLRLGSGLDPLSPNEADAIAIAGMGGLLIAEILRGGADKLTAAKRIILQPMTSVPELRMFLYQNGYKIQCEILAKEDSKIYNIISVIPNIHEKYAPTDTDLFIGKYLIEKRPVHFDEYLEQKQRKLENMISGLCSSRTEKSQKKLEMCKKLLKETERIKKESL